MLRKAENVFSVVLSDVSVATSTLPSVGDQVTSQNLSAGAVVMVNAGMYRTTLSALAAGDTYHIVQGKGAGQPLMKSPAIVKGSEKITSKEFVAPTQQITAIGSNGTTGSLTAANNQSYYVKVRKNDNDSANQSQPFSLFGQYKTGASATQVELAYGLVKNLNRNMRLEPANRYLKAEVIFDVAASNTEFGGLTNATGNVSVIKDSKVVTMADTQDLSAGDYFRIDEDATETLTAPVYQIESVDSSTQITLTSPYIGASATIDDDFIHLIPAATGNGADFGIKLTGIQSDFDVAAFRNHYVNRFTASFSDENITVTHLQGASEGNGSWQRVAMDEYMNYGYEGQNEMIGIPPKARDQEVKIPGKSGVTALDAKYSVINIKWVEDIAGLVSKSGAEGNVLIYLNLNDNSGSGELVTSPINTGSTLATALGITASTLNE